MTCENYACADASAVVREQTRQLYVKDFEKVNYDPARSWRNVVLEHDPEIDGKSFRAYVKDYKEQNGITGRFNIDTKNDRNATKVLSCFVMSGSQDLMAGMARKEQVEYFRAGLEFLKQEYPSFHVVDCRIHYDEAGLPHAHTAFLPISEREDGSKVFNISRHQKGKDYFKGFQDRFFEFMRERYPEKELQRRDPQADHSKKLTVKEYKENQDLKREIEREHQRLLKKADKLQEIEAQLEQSWEVQEQAWKYNQAVERYCAKTGWTRFQYEKECYYADAGLKDYPAPERLNPDREIEEEPSRTQHSRDIDLAP